MRLIAALALLVSVNAYACPDLSGSFTCTYQDGTTEAITISQDNKDGVTVYRYNNSDLPADNQVHPIADSQNIKNGTFRAWCDEKEATLLQTEILGKYYQDGSYYGDLTMDMAMSLSGNDLHQVTNAKIVNSGGTYPSTGETTCVRDSGTK